jgi:hypothetical protein
MCFLFNIWGIIGFHYFVCLPGFGIQKYALQFASHPLISDQILFLDFIRRAR